MSNELPKVKVIASVEFKRRLLIYSKSAQENVAAKTIKEIIDSCSHE